MKKIAAVLAAVLAAISVFGQRIYLNSATTNANPTITSAATANLATNVPAVRVYGNFSHIPNRIPNLWTNTPNNVSPLNIVLIGDSLSANKEPEYIIYFKQKSALLGQFISGGSFTYTGGGAYSTTEFTNWISGVVSTLPATATAVTMGNVLYQFGDTADLLWLSGTNFGNFEVYCQTNTSSTYIFLTNITCAAASTNLNLSSISLPWCDLWNIKLISTNAMTMFLGLTVRHHVSAGVTIWDFAQGGYDWDSFSQCPTNVLAQIGSVLHPDLVLVEETSTSNLWATFAPLALNPIAATATNADFVIIEPNVMSPTMETANLAQIGVMDNMAMTNNWILYKQHSLWSSWTNAVAWGYMNNTNSDPHPTLAGNTSEINSFFRDAGISSQFIKAQSDMSSTVINYSDSVPATTFLGLSTSATLCNRLIMRQNLNTGYGAQILYQDLQGNNIGAITFDGTTFGLGGNNLVPQFKFNLATALTTVSADLAVPGNGGTGVAIWAQNGRQIIGNGSGLTNLQGSATNTLIVGSLGITNNTTFCYLVSITAGTAMAMKDPNNVQFMTPILGSAYPLKPGWGLSGTAITATCTQFP